MRDKAEQTNITSHDKAEQTNITSHDKVSGREIMSGLCLGLKPQIKKYIIILNRFVYILND